MSAHLGAELAALVDGELSHADRERVLRHLSRCADCRTEVEAQRRFKAQLLGLGTLPPDPVPDLAARLRGLAPEAVASGARTFDAMAGLTPGRRGRLRPPAARGSRRPHGRRRLPRTAVGGVVLAFGLSAVLALGGAHGSPTRTPVDPTSDAFLVDYANSSGELPLPEPAGVTSAGLGR